MKATTQSKTVKVTRAKTSTAAVKAAPKVSRMTTKKKTMKSY